MEESFMKQVFRDAYRHNIWGDPESVSGPGSGLARTAAFRDQIPKLLIKLGARTLLDVGCGDLNWMKELQLPIERYFGVDIVSELINHNRTNYSDREKVFIHGDLTRDDLPRSDIILCRDCLVHFSFEDVWAALRNFKRSRSHYLLTTTFIEFPTNLDIETGGWRQLNLERPPFNFPPPKRMIDEKCLHTGGIYADKRLALWELEDIDG
jgi:SAM-dependent methyltransferase